MAKFQSVKAALGYYFAFRRGPRLAQQQLAPRIQSSAHVDADDWIKMAKIITAVSHRSGVGRSVLLRWAGSSDGAVEIDGKLGAALADLRVELERAGLVDPKVEPVKCEDHEWVDLNTGRVYRSKRAK